MFNTTQGMMRNLASLIETYVRFTPTKRAMDWKREREREKGRRGMKERKEEREKEWMEDKRIRKRERKKKKWEERKGDREEKEWSTLVINKHSLALRYGFVPNGGRIYYTGRSQPPLLTWMVYSYYEATNDTGFVRELLPALDKEYQFWMNNRSVYVSQCNCTANRYASPVTTPR